MKKIKNASQNKYIKNTYKRVEIKFHNIYDDEMIEHLSTIENRQNYIKNLIKNDMRK